MATFVNLQDELLEMLGRPDISASDVFRTRAKFYLNRAYLDIASRFDLPDLVTSESIVSIASTADYALGANVLFILSIVMVNTSPAEQHRLIKKGISSVDEMTTAVEGTPVYYARFGLKITVEPIPPDADITFKVRHIQRPTELSADGDIPVLSREWDNAILYRAAQFFFIGLGEMDRGQIFLGVFNDYVQGRRVTDRMRSLGADEGIELVGADVAEQSVGRPGTVAGRGISAPAVG